MGGKLNVECPKCGLKFNYHDSEHRPFCSKRCKMVDLGHWLDESYTVPSEEKPEQEKAPKENQ